MSTHSISVTINGTVYEGDVDSRLLLVHWIRDVLHLTGTHIGCDTTSCGACTILVDGKATKSCTMFAVQANGRQVMTVEGLEHNGKLHPLQEGFHEMHALQCGYCTPGMMTGLALLQRNPNPSEHEIRVGISGNLCRCTGCHPKCCVKRNSRRRGCELLLQPWSPTIGPHFFLLGYGVPSLTDTRLSSMNT